MQALHDIVQAGFVRYIGMSSCWAWQFQLMQRAFSFTFFEDSEMADKGYY
jgi:aryl-alcohol dehydrogenase-like predicted oxidoreductase